MNLREKVLHSREGPGQARQPAAAATIEAAGAVTLAFTVQGVQLGLAMMTGLKLVENRSFKLRLGWLALHVGKSQGTKYGDMAAKMYPEIPSPEDHVGAIIGLVLISEHRVPQQCGGNVWAIGPQCSVISHAVRLQRPIPSAGLLLLLLILLLFLLLLLLLLQGQQSLWKIQPTAGEELRRQLLGGGCKLQSYDLSAIGPRPTEAIPPLPQRLTQASPTIQSGR